MCRIIDFEFRDVSLRCPSPSFTFKAKEALGASEHEIQVDFDQKTVTRSKAEVNVAHFMNSLKKSKPNWMSRIVRRFVRKRARKSPDKDFPVTEVSPDSHPRPKGEPRTTNHDEEPRCECQCKHCTKCDHKVSPGVLPLHLEQKIFEIASRTDRATAVNLQVVASRVRTWTEPILYESITVDAKMAPNLLRTIKSKRREFFGFNVKEVLFNQDCCSALEKACIISACSGVHYLCDVHAGSHNVVPYGSITSLHLLGLGINIHHFEDFGISSSSNRPYFMHPAFAQLTHLDVMGNPLHWSVSGNLPSLTHFSIIQDGVDERHRDMIWDLKSFVFEVLTSCESLKILLLHIYRDDEETENQISRTMMSFTDPRIFLHFENRPMDDPNLSKRALQIRRHWRELAGELEGRILSNNEKGRTSRPRQNNDRQMASRGQKVRSQA